MILDIKSFALRVQAVAKQVEVYNADMAVAVQRQIQQPTSALAVEKAPREHAIDGVAYHVFNTLRGTDDTIDGATFEDVRAIVAEYF
jgi:hypothetical protein